jgi:hypothetical protein
MPRPEWRDPVKERHWRRLLAQWRRSGMTGRDFCAKHALAEPSFYAWKREIAQRDRERAAGAKGLTRGRNRRIASSSARGDGLFIDLTCQFRGGCSDSSTPASSRLICYPVCFQKLWSHRRAKLPRNQLAQ